MKPTNEKENEGKTNMQTKRSGERLEFRKDMVS